MWVALHIARCRQALRQQLIRLFHIVAQLRHQLAVPQLSGRLPQCRGAWIIHQLLISHQAEAVHKVAAAVVCVRHVHHGDKGANIHIGARILYV